MKHSKARARAQSLAKTQREYRARLKSLGLFGKKTDLRKRVSTRQKNIIVKFMDVLKGRASVITVPKSKTKRFRKAGRRVVGDHVVIRKSKGERVRYDKASGEIVTKRKEGKVKVTRHIAKNDIANSKASPGMKGRFVLPTVHGSYSFHSWQSLENFMARDSVHNSAKWLQQVEFEEIAYGEEWDDDAVPAPRASRKRKKRRRKRRAR
jgi:hypothetical protein